MKTLLFTLFCAAFIPSGYSVVYITTAVAGTWSPAGPPNFQGGDDITVAHDWSSHNNPIFNNFTGSLTINTGAYLHVEGTFHNWYGTINIQAGGTLYVNGGCTFAPQEAIGWGVGTVTNNGTITIIGDFANQYCNNCVTCSGLGDAACAVDPDCHWLANGSVSVGGNYSSNGLCDNVLPVELLKFSSERIDDDDSNVLNWSTGSEINNDHFEIERSWDGKIFEVVGTKKGAGNSSTVLNYSFVDELHQEAPTSSVYYRLKQVDFDNAFSYSPISVVKRTLKSKVIQNEMSGHFKIIPAYSNEYNVVAYGVDGRLLSREKVTLNKGVAYDFTINYKGAYVLSITSKRENTIKKGIITSVN